MEDSKQLTQGRSLVLQYDVSKYPMVCGVCSNQFALAQELEDHMAMHRENPPVEENDVELMVSQDQTMSLSSCKDTKRVNVIDLDDHLSSLDCDHHQIKNNQYEVLDSNTAISNSLGKQSQPQVSRLQPGPSFQKGDLPFFDRSGVPVARIDDFVPSTSEIELSHTAILSSDDTTSQQISSTSHLTNQKGSRTVPAYTLVPSTTRRLSANVTDRQKALSSHSYAHSELSDLPDALLSTESGAHVLEDGITHIEVQLEGFSPEIMPPSNAGAGGNTEMVCEICEKKYLGNEMQDHMLNEHVVQIEDSNKYLCPRLPCVQLFNSMPDLRAHIGEHDKSNLNRPAATIQMNMPTGAGLSSLIIEELPTSFDCQVCGQVFKSKRAQGSHMKKHTKILEPVTCEKCGKGFNHPSALKFHQSMSTNCDKPKYVCDLCGYKAVTPWRLQSHHNQVHSSDRPYTCQTCQKSYKTKEMLKLHAYKIHTGKRTLKCNHCSRMFFYPAEVREHMQTHAETKKFTCNLCNLSFKTMHTYRGHMNGKHSKIWYTCGFCHFTTAHRKSMKRHMVLVHKLQNVVLEVHSEDNPPLNNHMAQIEVMETCDDMSLNYVSEVGELLNHQEPFTDGTMDGIISLPSTSGPHQSDLVNAVIGSQGQQVIIVEQPTAHKDRIPTSTEVNGENLLVTISSP